MTRASPVIGGRRRRSAKWALLALGCVLLLTPAAAGGCGEEPPGPSPSPTPAEVLARVRDEPVTAADVRATQRLAAFSGETLADDEALEQAIREELIAQEAARLDVSVPDAALEERIDSLAAGVGGEDELRAALRDGGLTLAELRTGVAAVLLAEALQDARFAGVRADRAEARRFYDENTALFTIPAEVDLADLAVRTEAAARDVIGRIDGGQSFESAARQFSVDPELRAQGGLLGWVRLDSIPDGAREIIAELPEDELSAPVQVGALWHVFKVLGRRPERVRPFSEVAAELIAELTRRERAAALVAWLGEERQRSGVVVTVDGP